MGQLLAGDNLLARPGRRSIFFRTRRQGDGSVLMLKRREAGDDGGGSRERQHGQRHGIDAAPDHLAASGVERKLMAMRL